MSIRKTEPRYSRSGEYEGAKAIDKSIVGASPPVYGGPSLFTFPLSLHAHAARMS